MNRESSMHSPSSGLINTLLLAGAAGIVVSLAVVLANLSQEHHGAFGTSSDGVVWGLPVATYIYFALASMGLMFVASLAMVFGMKQYYPIAKRCTWLSLITLAAGFTALAFELGHPLRMLWALPLSFQVRSPLNWMGVFYASCVVLLVLKFRLLNAGDWASPASRRLGMATLVMEVLAAGTLGLAFSIIAARPFWFGGTVPLYFLITALTTGVALAVLVTYAAYGFDRARMPGDVQSLLGGSMPGLFATVLGLTLAAVAARTVAGLWSHHEGFEAFDRMAASPWFHFEIWVGMLLPLLLLAAPGTRKVPGVQIACAALVLVALFINRYEFIVGGQSVPVFKGIAGGDFAAYTPSTTEVLLVVLSASIVIALYAAGEKYLRLDSTPDPDTAALDEASAWLASAGARDETAAKARRMSPAAAD